MVPRRVVILFSVLILQLALLSCQKEAEVEPVEEMIPLQVGNRWDYDVIKYYYNGEVVDTTRYTRMVVRDTVIQNSTWYVLSDGYIVRNSGDGYVYYNIAGSQPVMLYQSKAYGGIGYSYEYPNYTQYILTTRSYELAPVPDALHTYDAYLFNIEHQHTEHEFNVTKSYFKHDYVAPGVGLVRSESFFDDSDKVMRRYELKSYQLN